MCTTLWHTKSNSAFNGFRHICQGIGSLSNPVQSLDFTFHRVETWICCRANEFSIACRHVRQTDRVAVPGPDGWMALELNSFLNSLFSSRWCIWVDAGGVFSLPSNLICIFNILITKLQTGFLKNQQYYDRIYRGWIKIIWTGPKLCY